MNTKNTTDWMQLIQECRTSGLSDREWCSQNGIPVSTFYYHIKRLREQACDIPASVSRNAAGPSGTSRYPPQPGSTPCHLSFRRVLRSGSIAEVQYLRS